MVTCARAGGTLGHHPASCEYHEPVTGAMPFIPVTLDARRMAYNMPSDFQKATPLPSCVPCTCLKMKEGSVEEFSSWQSFLGRAKCGRIHLKSHP